MTDVKNQETNGSLLDALVIGLLFGTAMALLITAQPMLNAWCTISFTVTGIIFMCYFYYRLMHTENGSTNTTFLLFILGLAISAFFGHFQLVGLIVFGTLGIVVFAFFAACLITMPIEKIKQIIKRFREM